MDHDYLDKLKQTHPALRLLAADNAPLIISFLFHVFIQPNHRSLSQPDLTSRLDDYLYHLNNIHGVGKYPKSARQYLEDWSGGKTPFLRKYYTDINDEPEFDITPATEKAIEWVQSLEDRQFVGTESRLLTVFTLLRELVHKTSLDPEARITELERQKTELDAEIGRVRAGVLDAYDATQVKERFFQAEETGRRLLADFRQVEHNFRSLDRQIRERIATSDKPKGQLLDEIFLEQDAIRDSDQGKSFNAFWEFLMSSPRQEELASLLEAVYGLEEIKTLDPDPFLGRIKFSLMDAGEKVYKTTSVLVEQLRKYLDDQSYLENRRIMEIIRGIEKLGVILKDAPPDTKEFTCLDDIRPGLELVMARGLFTPTSGMNIRDSRIDEGTANPDIDVDILYRQNVVNEAELRRFIEKALQSRSQVTLAQLTEQFPICKGLAEVVVYLELAHKLHALVSTDQIETLTYTSDHGTVRQVELPRVLFIR